MDEQTLNFLLNYDYTEIEKIPGHIQEIAETQKEILDELQKEPPEEIPEEVEVLSLEDDELLLQEVEETDGLPVEEEIDYLALIYAELQEQNELTLQNQTAVIQHLETIETQGIKGNEVDGMVGLYLMYLVPLAVVVSLGSKVLNPFLRG